MLPTTPIAFPVPRVGNTPLVQHDPFAELQLAAAMDLYAVDPCPALEPIFKAYAEGKPIPEFYYPPPIKPWGPRAQNMPPPPPPQPIKIALTREELARGVTQFGVKIPPQYLPRPVHAPYKPKEWAKPPTFEELNPGCVDVERATANSTTAVVNFPIPRPVPAGQDTVRSTTAVVGTATSTATPASTVKSTTAVVGACPPAPAQPGYISLANYPPPPAVPASLSSHLSISTTAATVASPLTPPPSPPSLARTIKPEPCTLVDDMTRPTTPASPPTPIIPGAYPQCAEYPAVPLLTPPASPVSISRSSVSKKVPGAYPEYPKCPAVSVFTPPPSPPSFVKSLPAKVAAKSEAPVESKVTVEPEVPVESTVTVESKPATKPEAKPKGPRTPAPSKRVPVPAALLREFGSSKRKDISELAINKELPQLPLPPQYCIPEHIKALAPKTKPYTGPPRPLPDCYYPPILDTSDEATIVPRRA